MSPRPRRPALPALVVAAAFAVAACGGAGTASPSPATPAPATPSPSAAPATPAPTSDAPGTPAPSAVPPTPAATPVLDQPWATAELVDVATGEPFTIAELAASGRTVVLETMAIWCTSCLAQQRRIDDALGRIDRVKVAYVVLTVDPSEDGAKLARYKDQNGFEGLYAVAGRDHSRALAADFGDQVLNPPATPVIVISPSGRVTLTDYGPKSTEQIVSLIEAHRA